MRDEAGAKPDFRPALALLAAPEPLVDPEELTPALRRAMLLLAAGGDPHRELELDGRAVTSLAAELDAPELRAALGRGLGALALAAAAYPSVAAAVSELQAGAELAVRAWACALLAEEL